MALRHVVITAVARDDLPDGGASHFRETIRAVRAVRPGIAVEVLTPDFGGCRTSIQTVVNAHPDVFNHNLETVRRLTPTVRHRARYERSLEVLRLVGQLGQGRPHVKSGLMLGLGETDSEVEAAMGDLREASCTLLTLGQYLQPSMKHLPVVEFVSPAQFDRYGAMAKALGFRHVASAPKVRSSYHADDFDPGEGAEGVVTRL
jgi:lipoic acid synthetase